MGQGRENAFALHKGQLKNDASEGGSLLQNTFIKNKRAASHWRGSEQVWDIRLALGQICISFMLMKFRAMNSEQCVVFKNIYQQFSITLYSTNCNFKGNFTSQSENNNATVIKATILLQCVLYNPVTQGNTTSALNMILRQGFPLLTVVI